MGGHRVDTIELLEAIGSDASLRYAAADELKGVLERARADAGFVNAVVAGDGVQLRAGLGIREEQHVQQTNAPGHGDEEEEGEDEGEEEGGEPLPPRR